MNIKINKEIESDEVATGFGNLIGNKGGIGISFKFFQKSFLFINCHLPGFFHY